MFKQSGKNLLNELKSQVQQWMSSFDTVITDCDGVLWVYNNVLEGAPEAVRALQKLGKKVYFCTNNSTKTRQEIFVKAVESGFKIKSDDIIATANSTANYLRNRDFKKRVYVIGKSGITRELDAAGIKHTTIGPDVMPGDLSDYITNHFTLEDDIGAVIIGFDEHFSYPKMVKASTYLMDPNCLFIVTNTDERFPMPNIMIPGTGCIARCVQASSERDPIVIGKPNPAICGWLLQKKLITPERTLMIGDRCNTDILLGYNCGFQTLLVGTGVNSLDEIECWRKSGDPELLKLVPDVYLPKLGDLLELLPK